MLYVKMFGLGAKKPKTPAEIQRNNVVFIDRDKVIVVVLPDERLYMCRYPDQFVIDGDVINREEFREWFAKWIRASGIMTADTVFVVLPTFSFQKDFGADPLPAANSENTLGFIDSVPFQKVITAQYTNQNSTTIIAANKELLNGVTFSFESQGFKRLALFPYKAQGDRKINKSDNPEKNLVETAKMFIDVSRDKNHEVLEFGASLQMKQSSSSQASIAQVSQTEVNPMVAVVIVLLFMFVGGGIMYWQLTKAETRRVAVSSPEKGLLPVNASATDEPPKQAEQPHSPISEATKSAELAQKKGKIEVLYVEETQAAALNIKVKLEQLSYEVVTNRIASPENKTNHLIFTSVVAPNIRADIDSVLKTAALKLETKQGTLAEYVASMQLVKYIPSAPTPTRTPTPTPIASSSAVLATPSGTLR
jgi:hypothetical protein